MKISKVFAGLSAAALAASAMSMVSFADEAASNSGTAYGAYLMVGGAEGYGNWNLGDYAAGDATITGDGQYTVSYKVPGDVKIGEELAVLTVQTDIAKDFDGEYAEQDVKIKIDSVSFDGKDAAFDIAAAEKEGDEDSVWIENGIRATVVNAWGHDLNALAAKPSGASEVSVTFTVSGLGGGSTESTEYQFAYPEDAVFANGGKSWGGVEFESLKETDFNQWDGIWWQLGVPTPEVAEGETPNFTVDTANAKAVIEIKFAQDVAEGAEVIRYIDTTDGTKYSVKADKAYKAGEGMTIELNYDEVWQAAFDETDKGWEGADKNGAFKSGFGGNFQFAAAGKVSSFLTGYKVTVDTPVVDNSSSDVSSEADDSSKVESKKSNDSSSKAANTASTTNPGTGAAALAAVGVALAGAAVVTSKKRK